MAPGDIPRFVAHYERLTRWILAEMPQRADWVVTLDKDRQPYA
jgi:D-glycerate 3-kinase